MMAGDFDERFGVHEVDILVDVCGFGIGLGFQLVYHHTIIQFSGKH